MQYYQPEPYQADRPAQEKENKTLWQHLMERRHKNKNSKDSTETDVITADDVGVKNTIVTTTSTTSTSQSKQQDLSRGQPLPNYNTPLPTQQYPTVFNPRLVPSVPDPRRRPSIKFDSPPLPGPTPGVAMGRTPTHLPQLFSPQPSNPSSVAPNHNRRMDIGQPQHHQPQQPVPLRPSVGSKLMSAFLEPPPPKPSIGVAREWKESSFIPSIPAPAHPSSRILSGGNTIAPLVDRPTIVVTPKSKPPNTIPFRQDQGQGPPGQQHIVQQQQQQQQQPQQPPPPPKGVKTPQQILRQQIFGNLPLGNLNIPPRPSQSGSDQVAQPTDGFWNRLQDRPVTANNELMIAQESLDQHRPNGLWQQGNNNNNPTPIPQVHPASSPQPRVLQVKKKGNRNEIVNPTSVKILNTGSSGLQMVETNVPASQNTNSFNIGSSLVVASSTTSKDGLVQGQVLTSSNEDPNIILPSQVPTGTPIPQGPHGPMVATPRPASFPVAQTPNAPQVAHRLPDTQPLARGVGGIPVQGNRQLLGPGNYNPPVQSTPRPMQGNPGSGQQLLKNFIQERHLEQQQRKLLQQQQQQELLQRQQQQELLQQQQQNIPRLSLAQVPSGLPQQRHSTQGRQQQQHHHQQQQQQQSGNPLFNILSPGAVRPNPSPPRPPPHSQPQRPQGLMPRLGEVQEKMDSFFRRQDLSSAAILPAAAVGALSAGLTPMTIFSNLLNAYATIDSKHDITGKLMQSATNWLSPDEENKTSETTTTLTTQRSTTMAL